MPTPKYKLEIIISSKISVSVKCFFDFSLCLTALTGCSSAPLCPDCREEGEPDSRGGDEGHDRTREQQGSAGLKRSKRFVQRRSVQTETKFIELMVVNDNDMVSLAYSNIFFKYRILWERNKNPSKNIQ